MSNKIKVNVKSLDAKSLLTDPSIVVLDTKNTLILNDVSVNLDSTLLESIQSSMVNGIDILGLTACVHEFIYTNNGDGTHTGKCNLCGYTFTEGHDTYSYSGKAPTCDASGYYGGTRCRKCNYKTGGGYRAALGHNYSTTTAATCTTSGTKTCSRCGGTQTIAAYGHTYVYISGREATCTKIGFKNYECSSCGDPRAERIPVLGHDFVNGTCTRCGTKS